MSVTVAKYDVYMCGCVCVLSFDAVPSLCMPIPFACINSLYILKLTGHKKLWRAMNQIIPLTKHNFVPGHQTPHKCGDNVYCSLVEHKYMGKGITLKKYLDICWQLFSERNKTY